MRERACACVRGSATEVSAPTSASIGDCSHFFLKHAARGPEREALFVVDFVGCSSPVLIMNNTTCPFFFPCYVSATPPHPSPARIDRFAFCAFHVFIPRLFGIFNLEILTCLESFLLPCSDSFYSSKKGYAVILKIFSSDMASYQCLSHLPSHITCLILCLFLFISLQFHFFHTVFHWTDGNWGLSLATLSSSKLLFLVKGDLFATVAKNACIQSRLHKALSMNLKIFWSSITRNIKKKGTRPFIGMQFSMFPSIEKCYKLYVGSQFCSTHILTAFLQWFLKCYYLN